MPIRARYRVCFAHGKGSRRSDGNLAFYDWVFDIGFVLALVLFWEPIRNLLALPARLRKGE